jgi:hypothetical protein
MSWGPNDNMDMYTRKPQRVVDDECKRLCYGPNVRLIVELDDDGWSWLERQLDTGKNIAQKERFSTFLEAVQNYGEVTSHDKRQHRD